MTTDYDKSTQGNLPGDTTAPNNFFGSMVGSFGGAYLGSLNDKKAEEINQAKAKQTKTILIIGLIGLVVVIYFARKKKKGGK